MEQGNPNGIFIQALGMNSQEEDRVVEHCVRANYTTVSVMDSFGLCQKIKDRLPNCVVVHRSSTFEPGPSGANRAVFQKYIQGLAQDKRIVLMINCEQGFDADRVKMWCDMIDAADDYGWKLCVGNVSSGSVKCGQGTDPNEWLSIGAPLLIKLASHPGHPLAYHDYTSAFAWLVANGGWGNPWNPPEKIDWKKPQWHLGRNIQGITAACEALKIPLPYMIVTEGIIDQMNDVASNPTNPYRNIMSNRWRYLIPAWAQWYPGKHPEDILANQVEWAWENIYAPCEKVIGLHFFTWLSDYLRNGEWKDDDVSNAPIYQKRMESYRPKTLPPVVEVPPTDPIPPDRELVVRKYVIFVQASPSIPQSSLDMTLKALSETLDKLGETVVASSDGKIVPVITEE